MSNTFLIADLHFSHSNICTFLQEDGTKVRPWDHVKEMDEALISNWNNVVNSQDKVYVLGDLLFSKKALPIMDRLNGRKILIKGNHDCLKIKDYLPYFYDVRACHPLDKFILTHIPIHEQSLERWKGNIHGHLHTNRVLKTEWYRDEEGEWNTRQHGVDPRYLCVSVEHINFTPISFEDAKKRFEEQQ